jgi:hypothetical protein
MLITEKSTQFAQHPPGSFRAVCVDCTDLKSIETRYGRQEVFRYVFETELTREDGLRWCAWGRNLSLSLYEKSNLRKLLKQWFGRDLTAQERQSFDTDSMVGVPANLVITHDDVNGTTYANIVAVTPDRGATPLTPSGKYVRQKDRPPKDAVYSRTSAPATRPQAAYTGWKAAVVHVGANAGRPLGDLSEAQLVALYDKWIPQVGKSPTPEDSALIDALKECFDNIPY